MNLSNPKTLTGHPIGDRNPMPRNPQQITLAQMADKINDQFGKYLDEPVSHMTPYDWWKRTKDQTISEPLPAPVLVVGRSPVFRWTEILPWFVRYKGIGTRIKIKTKDSVSEGDYME